MDFEEKDNGGDVGGYRSKNSTVQGKLHGGEEKIDLRATGIFIVLIACHSGKVTEGAFPSSVESPVVVDGLPGQLDPYRAAAADTILAFELSSHDLRSLNIDCPLHDTTIHHQCHPIRYRLGPIRHRLRPVPPAHYPIAKSDQKVRSEIRNSETRDAERSYPSSHIAPLVAVGGAKMGEASEVERGPPVPRVADKLECLAHTAIFFWIAINPYGQVFWAEKLGTEIIGVFLHGLCSENEGNNA
ncbi:hypothetical protein MMC32_000683 [Xylographa parallela]|nr:hypothetical protein [Xylographa parallela]